MSKRDELLKLLSNVAEGEGGSPVKAHMEAEELLLALLGDAEVTDAWDEASDQWWYA